MTTTQIIAQSFKRMFIKYFIIIIRKVPISMFNSLTRAFLNALVYN